MLDRSAACRSCPSSAADIVDLCWVEARARRDPARAVRALLVVRAPDAHARARVAQRRGAAARGRVAIVALYARAVGSAHRQRRILFLAGGVAEGRVGTGDALIVEADGERGIRAVRVVLTAPAPFGRVAIVGVRRLRHGGPGDRRVPGGRIGLRGRPRAVHGGHRARGVGGAEAALVRPPGDAGEIRWLAFESAARVVTAVCGPRGDASVFVGRSASGRWGRPACPDGAHAAIAREESSTGPSKTPRLLEDNYDGMLGVCIPDVRNDSSAAECMRDRPRSSPSEVHSPRPRHRIDARGITPLARAPGRRLKPGRGPLADDLWRAGAGASLSVPA